MFILAGFITNINQLSCEISFNVRIISLVPVLSNPDHGTQQTRDQTLVGSLLYNPWVLGECQCPPNYKDHLVMQYSIAATECFQFLWLENISILNNREVMITSSPPSHPQCRDSLDHQPRRHSYRGKPFHCQHCLVLQCSLMMWYLRALDVRAVKRQLPECKSHGCRLLHLLPFLSLSREDETFLPRTELDHLSSGGAASGQTHPRFSLQAINYFVIAINLLWPRL